MCVCVCVCVRASVRVRVQDKEISFSNYFWSKLSLQNCSLDIIILSPQHHQGHETHLNVSSRNFTFAIGKKIDRFQKLQSNQKATQISTKR